LDGKFFQEYIYVDVKEEGPSGTQTQDPLLGSEGLIPKIK